MPPRLQGLRNWRTAALTVLTPAVSDLSGEMFKNRECDDSIVVCATADDVEPLINSAHGTDGGESYRSPGITISSMSEKD